MARHSQTQRLHQPLRLLPLGWGQRLEAGQPPLCRWGRERQREA